MDHAAEPGELATVTGKSIGKQAEVPVQMTRRGTRTRKDDRADLPPTPHGLFAVNLWNANTPGTSRFPTISNMTFEQKWGQYENNIPTAINGAEAIAASIPRPTAETIEVAKDFCKYVYEAYGRFPANLDPMYQRLACQVQHIDSDFYDGHYPPGAYTDQHTEHFRRWHPEQCDEHGKPPRRTDAERVRGPNRGFGPALPGGAAAGQ